MQLHLFGMIRKGKQQKDWFALKIKTGFMGMNKNTIFAWASFFMLLIGIALVLLGVLKYQDYAIGFSTVGIGFFVMSWAFNALKGRV